jgi:hypothetical protein
MLNDKVEEKIIDVLVEMDDVEYDERLIPESANVVRGQCRCSNEVAVALVTDLEKRKRIERELTQGGGSPTQKSHWRWKRPT